MSLVEIHRVVLNDSPGSRVTAASIDGPRPGTETDVYAISLKGWILAEGQGVPTVKVLADGHELRSVPVGIRRSDVAHTHQTSLNTGFESWVSVLGLPADFELRLHAVLENGHEVPFASIHGKRRRMESSVSTVLQPLVITSLGRMGTTWLMRLLLEHPNIVVDDVYPYETRSASYWMQMLKVLAEPGNHLQSSHPDRFHADGWFVGQNPYYLRHYVGERENLWRWYGRTYVEHLVALCQRSIEEFYSLVASTQGKQGGAYFAEKLNPTADQVIRLMEDMYPRKREILLVRDFRDWVCSILSFNQKRGYAAFGRGKAPNDEEYIRQLRGSVRRMLHVRETRPDVHLLRYEDLVASPADSLSSVLQYLDIDSNPGLVQGMLESASEETSELRRHRTTSDVKASVGRWRRDLSASVVAACEERFGDVLQAFGYDLNNTTRSGDQRSGSTEA